MQNNYIRHGEGGGIMEEQILIQFRADKALKQEVAEIYETLGMDFKTSGCSRKENCRKHKTR